MESEKVKEIKKALQDHSIEKLKYQDGIKIKEIDFIDILTLINELEKGNEALSFAVKQGFNDCQTKTLKQFAERLKEKLKDNVNGNNVDNYVECSRFISETLKEFISKNN